MIYKSLLDKIYKFNEDLHPEHVEEELEKLRRKGKEERVPLQIPLDQPQPSYGPEKPKEKKGGDTTVINPDEDDDSLVNYEVP